MYFDTRTVILLISESMKTNVGIKVRVNIEYRFKVRLT